MQLKVSKKIFAHIDCDSFFASCEIYKNPSLRDKMVCVGTDIIVAASYNAKALGIGVGTPIWEAKKMLKGHGIFLPVDMKLYGQMSKKLMNYLKQISENVEVFSIDEAFVELTGYDKISSMTYTDIGKKLQRDILQTIGIPVSIGIANTRIKAKIFSKLEKPLGVCVPSQEGKEEEIFESLYFGKIPFIGKGYQEKLRRKIQTISDFKKLGYWYFAKNMGKNGTTLWLELSGINAMTFRQKEGVKGLSRTRSFNAHKTNDKEFIWGQLMLNLHRIFEELVMRQYEARYLKIYLKTKQREKFSKECTFEAYTLERTVFIDHMKAMFDQIFLPDYVYRKTGVIVGDFRTYTPKQLSLFMQENISFEKKKNIEKTLEGLNKKYGRWKVKFGV